MRTMNANNDVRYQNGRFFGYGDFNSTEFRVWIRVRFVVAISLFAGLVFVGASSCSLRAEPLKLPYSGYVPAARGDGWAISDPASEGMDTALVERAFRLLHSQELEDFPTALSLLVARNGKLVAESYCYDSGDAERLQCVWSVTKSVTDLMFGVAIRDGLISESDLDKPIVSLMVSWPEGYADKEEITIRQALVMKSGISYENSGSDGDDARFFMGKPAGLLSYILSLPLESSPGAEFRYKNSDPQLVACLIADRAGKNLSEYAKETFFSPLGITDFRWDSYRDGVAYGAFGVWLKPRDMLRVGELVRQNGFWNGTEIVPSGWIAASTTAKARHVDGSLYGYYWWIRPQFGGFSAWGHGGQYIYVIPSLALTIVFTAEPNAEDVASDDLSEFERIVELLYRAAGGATVP